MDPTQFDRLTAALAVAGTRRGLVRLLAALPLGVALTILPGRDPDATAKKGGKKGGKGKGKRKRKNKNKDQDAGTTACTKRTCLAGACGSQSDGCGGTLSCGGCGANQLCDGGVCQNCTVSCLESPCDGAALQEALADGGTVYACPGTYQHQLLPFSISVNVTLVGAGQGGDPQADTILDAGNIDRVLENIGGATAELRQVRLINGNSITGGGVLNEGSTLIMTRCTVRDNASLDPQFSAGTGGGVYNAGSLTMTDCRIEANSADSGGGLYNVAGTAQLTNCVVTGNSADPNGGGGIYKEDGQVILTNTEVTNNTGGNCAPPDAVPGCVG